MTNKIELKTTEQYMEDFRPSYAPLMPAFIGNSTVHDAEVGSVEYKRVKTVGDIRSRVINVQDSEIKQLSIAMGKKKFSKFFLGSQFQNSELQSSQGVQQAIAKFLDEHNRQSDEMFLTGMGTDDATVKNNGLLFSQDENYTKRPSAEVQRDANNNWLTDLYTKVKDTIDEAQDLDGRILLLFYGERAIQEHNKLFVETKTSLIKTLRDAYSDVSFGKIPKRITPAGQSGVLAVNLDQVMLNYTILPELRNQGINEEKMYFWANFLMGSSMLDVQNQGGVVRQPLTWQAPA